jgi:hypothetical protein
MIHKLLEEHEPIDETSCWSDCQDVEVKNYEKRITILAAMHNLWFHDGTFSVQGRSA